MANIDYTLLGNLIAEPHFKTFDSGNAVLRFRVATSDAKKEKNDNGDDVWRDYNQFYVDVECWGQLAVNAGASLRNSSIRCTSAPPTVPGGATTTVVPVSQPGSSRVV